MIPRSMVTGKLDGAWRVVARSRPYIRGHPGLPETYKDTADNLAPENTNEIDWELQGLKNVRF